MGDLSAQAQDSHSLRATFERCAFIAIIAIVTVTFTAVIVGILYPPQIPPAVDWGRVIVDRANQSSGLIFDLLGALGSIVGITLTRGHFDERLKQRNGDQQ